MRQTITDWQSVPVIFDLPFCSRILGQSVESLKKRAQRGELPGAFKCGGHWRVDKSALRSHIENGVKVSEAVM